MPDRLISIDEQNKLPRLVDQAFAQLVGSSDSEFWAAILAAFQNGIVPSNLGLDEDGVPYISVGSNDVTVYRGEDGNYYFTTPSGDPQILPVNDVTKRFLTEARAAPFLLEEINTPTSPIAKALDAAFATRAPKPTGVAATDISNVQSLLDSLETFGGGHVQLHAGVYQMYLDVPKLCAVTGASEGATTIRLPNGANRNVIQTKGFTEFDALKTTMSTLDGVPHGVRIENLRIDGNKANNTTGDGLALWSIRTTTRNIYIYNCVGRGFYSNGIVGTTGGYPNGQCENIHENIWINQCKGVGFAHYGPHDAYADKIYVYGDVYGAGLANAAEVADLDVGYMHVYGGRVGVILKGNARFDHLQTENNMREGLISESNGSQTNSIGRLTAYGNWTTTPTATDYSIRLENRVDIRDAMIRCDHGENGLLVSGSGASGTTVNATITGTSSAGRHGLSVNANRVDITATIDNFPLSWQRYSNNSIYRIRAQNSSFAGYYEIDTTGSGNIIDFTFNASAAQHIPWILPDTLPRNTYRLISSGAVNWTMVWDGQNDSLLTTGISMVRRPVSSAVPLVSGTMQLTYFNATRNKPLTQVEVNVGSAAAGATPTLCRVGIYGVASNGDLTLLASTANDTGMMPNAFQNVTRPLSSSWTPEPSKRYALGILVVSAASMPQLYGNPNIPAAGAGKNPRITGQVTSLTDLPTTVAITSVTNSSKEFYASIT